MNQTNGHLSSQYSNNYSNINTTNQLTNHSNANSNGKREIPRLPTTLNKSNTSQVSSLNPSANVPTNYLSQNVQRNSLQSPAFDKSAISGLKSNSKLKRPVSDYSTTSTQSSSTHSSPIMSKVNNNQLKQPTSNLGSNTNLSLRSSNSFRSTVRSDSKTRSFGLQSKYNSLSKSNLNNGSINNLNKSNLNLNHALPTLVKQPSGLRSNLSGSTTQLTDALTNKRSLIKPKTTSSTTSTTSCLPAPKSRPTSAYLADGLMTSKSRSKLPNCSKTSSNLNLNEQSLVKPLNSIKQQTLKDSTSFNLKNLNKKPQTSNSIKSAVQNLSQSSSQSMIYKPYSSLNNRSRPKLSAKEAKINPNDHTLERNDLRKSPINLTKKANVQTKSPDKLDKCNIARVSPIRRPFTMSSNVKRQLNGSLNSSDQEDDDELFDNSTLNQPTSDDTNSFNSEDAKFYAVLSSSSDEQSHNSRRSREERRLRRASGQRSSSLKRNNSPTSNSSLPVSKITLNSSEANKKNDRMIESSKSQLKLRSSSTNLNKSNSSINTIDHKSSLNTMFPTLNRLHNANSIQHLNNSTVNTRSNEAKADEQDYQSDDAEITLYKLKSLDFNCNSSYSAAQCTKEEANNSNAVEKKDGNNNSLFKRTNTLVAQTTQVMNDNSQSNEYSSFTTTPALSSLLNNYMSRSIGSLTGSLNGGLNQLNNSWSTQKNCITPPLLPNFRSKSPNLLYPTTSNLLTATSSFQPQNFTTTFLPSPTPLQSTTNTVINNVQNTTVLNNIPSSFTSRLGKFGENRGSSLSLLSASSSNYSNNLSINIPYQSQTDHRLFPTDKTSSNEIKHLKNELNRANEKINLLKTQLVTSDQMVNSFEQSLQSKTSRMKHYVLQIEEKDREIEHLKAIIENLKKNYGISLDLNYRSNTNSPVLNSPSLHNSRCQANSSDNESMILKNKSKQTSRKGSKKRSDSKKSRANSAHTTDEEDTASLASLHSKDGTSWFKSSITRAFKKKSNRTKSDSNQELDKTLCGDAFNDTRHPHHPSQLHQSYIQQDKFKDGELVDLKAQLIEKEKCLTDERLKSLSREDEMMKLKECLNCLQQELFNLKKQSTSS